MSTRWTSMSSIIAAASVGSRPGAWRSSPRAVSPRSRARPSRRGPSPTPKARAAGAGAWSPSGAAGARRYDRRAMGMKHFRIDGPDSFDLDDIDPDDTSGGPSSKDEARVAAEEMHEKLADLQELLFAGHEHKLLIVLQGMDTSGKDGTVRHVMRGISPASVRVVSF